jgi:Na+/H+ antiporter NhaD/arsenite permease-like protein
VNGKATSSGRGFFTFLAGVVGSVILIYEDPTYPVAVSAGTVLSGANTYIGNAANFVVRSIIFF